MKSQANMSLDALFEESVQNTEFGGCACMLISCKLPISDFQSYSKTVSEENPPIITLDLHCLLPHTDCVGHVLAGETRCSGCGQHVQGGCCCPHTSTGVSTWRSHTRCLQWKEKQHPGHSQSWNSLWAWWALENQLEHTETMWHSSSRMQYGLQVWNQELQYLLM